MNVIISNLVDQARVVDGYVLGALGFTRDFSVQFYSEAPARQAQTEARRLWDPTPKNYNIIDDLDLLFCDPEARGLIGPSQRP